MPACVQCLPHDAILRVGYHPTRTPTIHATGDPTTASTGFKSAVEWTVWRGVRLGAPGQVGGHDPTHQLDAGVDIQLFVQTVHVRVDGAARQAQRTGNGGVAFVRHDVSDKAGLAHRKPELVPDARPGRVAKQILCVGTRGARAAPAQWGAAANFRTPETVAGTWLRGESGTRVRKRTTLKRDGPPPLLTRRIAGHMEPSVKPPQTVSACGRGQTRRPWVETHGCAPEVAARPVLLRRQAPRQRRLGGHAQLQAARSPGRSRRPTRSRALARCRYSSAFRVPGARGSRGSTE